MFNSSGSLATSLFAGRGITSTECAEHREGILCGQCKSGYSLTMYYAVSELNFMLVFVADLPTLVYCRDNSMMEDFTDELVAQLQFPW